MNLLDSHDAPRVLSIARGDKSTLRLATLLQMTFPGSPCIYYGDEIALRGTKRYDSHHRDQDARWPFPWHDHQQWDQNMLDFFRRIVALRHRWPVLRHGAITRLYAQDRQYAFLRSSDSQQLVVILNAADSPAHIILPVAEHFADGTRLETVFGPQGHTIVVDGRAPCHLAARSGVVLSAA